MRKIETGGNQAGEWQAYIDFLKTIPFQEGVRRNPLLEAYSRAFSVSSPTLALCTTLSIGLSILDDKSIKLGKANPVSVMLTFLSSLFCV
jgi:hypothetical protein